MLDKSLRDLMVSLVGEQQIQVSELKMRLVIDFWNIMKKKGFTTKDIASKLGTSEAYVIGIFQGDSDDSIESILKLAYTFDLKVTLTVKEKV